MGTGERIAVAFLACKIRQLAYNRPLKLQSIEVGCEGANTIESRRRIGSFSLSRCDNVTIAESDEHYEYSTAKS